jgi:hypothetical protein
LINGLKFVDIQGRASKGIDGTGGKTDEVAHSDSLGKSLFIHIKPEEPWHIVSLMIAPTAVLASPNARSAQSLPATASMSSMKRSALIASAITTPQPASKSALLTASSRCNQRSSKPAAQREAPFQAAGLIRNDSHPLRFKYFPASCFQG